MTNQITGTPAGTPAGTPTRTPAEMFRLPVHLPKRLTGFHFKYPLIDKPFNACMFSRHFFNSGPNFSLKFCTIHNITLCNSGLML